jgi:hypothetical protein
MADSTALSDAIERGAGPAAIHELSDVSPARVHVTLPTSVRIRREVPKALVVHYADHGQEDVERVEGMPVHDASQVDPRRPRTATTATAADRRWHGPRETRSFRWFWTSPGRYVTVTSQSAVGGVAPVR